MNGTDLKFKITLTDGTETEQTVRIFNGLSAYEVWLADGNEGTLDDYFASLKGDKGDQGDKGNPGPVATVEGIAPTGSRQNNVVLSRPTQKYLSGAGTITPICKNLQNETLYIHEDGAAIVTVDLANWTVSQLLPQYNLRLVMASNNSFTARIKAASYLWTPTGGYVSSYDIPVTHNLVVYDIFNSVGSGPMIVKKFPQS